MRGRSVERQEEIVFDEEALGTAVSAAAVKVADLDVAPEVALREAEMSARALSSIEAYARERQVALSRRANDAVVVRGALREAAAAACVDENSSPSSLALGLLASRSAFSRVRSDEPAWQSAGDQAWRALRALEAVETIDELHCVRLCASYEALRSVSRSEAHEASSGVSECCERVGKAVGACKRAEASVRKCRAAVGRAGEAARVADAERVAAARASARARSDFEALSSPSSSSSKQPGNGEAARKAAAAREKAQLSERRCDERSRDARARVARETFELRTAADAAIRAVREKEATECAATEAALRLRRDFATPRALEALREIARYERGHLEAKLKLVSDLDRILDETPARPEEHRRREPLAGRALELLQECVAKDYYAHRDESPSDAAVDAHVQALFAGGSTQDLPPLAAPGNHESKRRDVLRDAAAAAGFDEDSTRRLAAGVLRDEDRPPERDATAEALIRYVDRSRERAATVAKALNRQRSKSTAVGSIRALEALAALATHVVRACRAAGDGHTPGVILMLTQTFYFVEGRTGHDEDVRHRADRVYLKDKLSDDFLLRSNDDAFWRHCLAEAALSAVASTTVGYKPYWDLLFTEVQADVANDVHRAVHAQLAAFLFAMRDLGAAKKDVRAFALAMCAEYQLPWRDRATLLAPYDDDEEEEDTTTTTTTQANL
ncbi:hypothetical protein CTAYLR_000409 [Chrysophaeum taylorii]|uniref:Uncharacterized protein n=1 Tax=Chrysophaeum taylorii TaxID=2483200 RepID=A0AAD7UGM3_9STRA|nr:hypothetical protein CTAYLR_000409 [Chrysophaeum taylorii]